MKPIEISMELISLLQHQVAWSSSSATLYWKKFHSSSTKTLPNSVCAYRFVLTFVRFSMLKDAKFLSIAFPGMENMFEFG